MTTVSPRLTSEQIVAAYDIVAQFSAHNLSTTAPGSIYELQAAAMQLVAAVETDRESRQAVADAEDALAAAKAEARKLQTIAQLQGMAEDAGMLTFHGARNHKRVTVSRNADGYTVSAYQHRDDVDADTSPARVHGFYEDVTTVAEVIANGWHPATV